MLIRSFITKSFQNITIDCFYFSVFIWTNTQNKSPLRSQNKQLKYNKESINKLTDILVDLRFLGVTWWCFDEFKALDDVIRLSKVAFWLAVISFIALSLAAWDCPLAVSLFWPSSSSTSSWNDNHNKFIITYWFLGQSRNHKQFHTIIHK